MHLTSISHVKNLYTQLVDTLNKAGQHRLWLKLCSDIQYTRTMGKCITVRLLLFVNPWLNNNKPITDSELEPIVFP